MFLMSEVPLYCETSMATCEGGVNPSEADRCQEQIEQIGHIYIYTYIYIYIYIYR